MPNGDGVTVLPDGSAFAVVSFPLPEDHWIYEATEDGFSPPPPMPLRMGQGVEREVLSEQVRQAARWAISASTMRGKEMGFDPDAMVKNIIVGLFGYYTPDGLCGEDWADPDPVPPLWKPG